MFLRGEVDTSKGNRITDLVTLNEPSIIRARAYNPSTKEWSALNEAFFSIGSVRANSENLTISELHYHPSDPEDINEINVSKDRDDFEFVEFLNKSSSPIELGDIYFKEGINFQFDSNSIIEANGRAVIVRNLDAFRSRYDSHASINILGQYTGRLSNDGETIILAAKGRGNLIQFTYNDQEPWPISADGDGPSLILTGNNPDSSSNWRSNAINGGNPGLPDSAGSSNFEIWKTSNNLNETLGDNDNDGIPNLVEYAFNTDPNSNSSLATLKTSTINFLGENYLEIKYDKNSDANDISITIQNSEDLINWNNTSLELISEELDDDNKHKTLTYRTKSPITPESQNFFRFKVSL